MSGLAPGQIVTVFRSRLRPGHEDDYHRAAAEIEVLAGRAPGLVGFKSFSAPDGERVTVVTFTDEAAQDAWRHQVDHVVAQRRGRAEFYAAYSIQVARTVRAASFEAPAEPA